MTFFLDSNILIFILRGTNQRVADKLEQFPPSEVKIPSVVLAELVEGAYRNHDTKGNLEKMLVLISPYEVVPFDKYAAMTGGKIGAELGKEGKKIGPNDLLIAATTMSRGGILVTNNTKEFSHVPGLRIEDWCE
jgi:tRNA(fMet)-specific endonuclease VapC